MSFSAIKDITLSNERTVYDKYASSAASLVEKFSNENAAGMHKVSTVYYTTSADISVYDDSRKDNSAETNATTEKGYIEPYNVTTQESGGFVTDPKKSGFLKYEPKAAIEGSTNVTYFWVEDLKNWCTWAINGNDLYVGKPATNAYGLCVWNGKTGFEMLNLDGALACSDEKVNAWQNEILYNLRCTVVTKTLDANGKEVPALVTDEFIKQFRGDFKDFNIKPYNDRVPGMIAGTYPLRKCVDYSINDADNFQTIRYGNPMNIDLQQPASVSTYLRKVKNLYLDEGAVKRCWDWSLAKAEQEIWDHTHYNENSDTGGEETMDYVATIGATLFLGPAAGVVTWWAGSRKGNHNFMYKYRAGEHRMSGNADSKVFYDPNYGDTISWNDIATRYFSAYVDYGIPLQPYIKRTDGMPTSDSIIFEFKSSSYRGKFQEIFYRNGHLKWQNASSSDNKGYYSIGMQGEAPLRFGLFAGYEEVKSNKSIQDALNSDDVYKKKLGYCQHATNLDFMNLASVGIPPIYRLPSGEVGINTQMRIGGPRGLSGFDVDFLNKQCQKIFGTGQDKTINDHWLKKEVINTYDESKTSIKKLSDASLDSTKDSQTVNVVNNEICLSFSANNVLLTTSDIVSNDYVAKW